RLRITAPRKFGGGLRVSKSLASVNWRAPELDVSCGEGGSGGSIATRRRRKPLPASAACFNRRDGDQERFRMAARRLRKIEIPKKPAPDMNKAADSGSGTSATSKVLPNPVVCADPFRMDTSAWILITSTSVWSVGVN